MTREVWPLGSSSGVSSFTLTELESEFLDLLRPRTLVARVPITTTNRRIARRIARRIYQRFKVMPNVRPRVYVFPTFRRVPFNVSVGPRRV